MDQVKCHHFRKIHKCLSNSKSKKNKVCFLLRGGFLLWEGFLLRWWLFINMEIFFGRLEILLLDASQTTYVVKNAMIACICAIGVNKRRESARKTSLVGILCQNSLKSCTLGHLKKAPSSF